MGEAAQGRTNLDSETVMNQNFLDAVRLLLEVAPAVFRNSLFALKGGTAINLFVRDMPPALSPWRVVSRRFWRHFYSFRARISSCSV